MYTNACIWNLVRWYWWIYLQGSRGDTDIENRLVDTVGEGEGGMDWENSTETYTLPYVKQIESGICCVTQGAQLISLPSGVGYGGRWKGGSERRGYMYTCDWFMLMYGRSQHSIVKQLSSNLKKRKKKKKNITWCIFENRLHTYWDCKTKENGRECLGYSLRWLLLAVVSKVHEEKYELRIKLSQL